MFVNKYFHYPLFALPQTIITSSLPRDNDVYSTAESLGTGSAQLPGKNYGRMRAELSFCAADRFASHHVYVTIIVKALELQRKSFFCCSETARSLCSGKSCDLVNL